MQSKVAPYAAASDLVYGRRRRAAASATASANDPGVPGEEADIRLVIEEDEATGACVYIAVNRRTGEVLAKYRREQLLRMREDAGYSAGGVIRTKA
jgi:flagellar protein FlaG